jgi:hypothetical protein
MFLRRPQERPPGGVRGCLTRYGRLRGVKEVPMTNPLESIQPSLRYVREQRELEKVFVVDTPEGADGLGRVDLKSGHIKIPVRHSLEKPAPTEE